MLLERGRQRLLEAADRARAHSPPLADVYLSAAEALAEIGQRLATGDWPEGEELNIAGDLFAACDCLDDVDPGLAYELREAFAPLIGAFANEVMEIYTALKEKLGGE